MQMESCLSTNANRSPQRPIWSFKGFIGFFSSSPPAFYYYYLFIFNLQQISHFYRYQSQGRLYPQTKSFSVMFSLHCCFHNFAIPFLFLNFSRSCALTYSAPLTHSVRFIPSLKANFCSLFHATPVLE